MQRHTFTQMLTYRLYCSSICEPPAVQLEGAAPSLLQQQDCFIQAGVTTTHTPEACSQVQTIHNIRGRRGHKEEHTGQAERAGRLLCLQISGCLFSYCRAVLLSFRAVTLQTM